MDDDSESALQELARFALSLKGDEQGNVSFPRTLVPRSRPRRREENVRCVEIQNSADALARKGVFITRACNDNATSYADGLQQKVILIDRRCLAELMIEHCVGIAAEERACHAEK